MFVSRLDSRRRSGVAIVITLLCITVLTVIATAFLQSMSIERLTSRSQLSLMSAEEVAQAAADEALQKITTYMVERPYHAVGYKTIQGQITPVIMGSINYGTAPEQKVLVSGDPLNVTFTDGSGGAASNSIDLNFKTSSTDQYGWIGSPVINGAVQYSPRRALWVNLLSDPAQPEQPDPTRKETYNPIVARYAYWVEDETSKLDIGVAGNADGTGNRFLRSQIGDRVTDLDLSALPLLDQKPLPDDATGGSVLSKLITLRNSFPLVMQDPRILNRVAPDTLAANVADQVKFHATTHSLSNELAGTGRRRVNLNALVTNSLEPDKIAADIDDIAWLITGKHIMLAANPGSRNSSAEGLFTSEPELPPSDPSVLAPGFGDRLYFAQVSLLESYPEKKEIYLKKLAANIRDYIDTDSQPTVVDELGIVPPKTIPDLAPLVSETPLQAIGKESLPYMQEHAWRGYIENWTETTPAPNERLAIATFRIDHYFEFYNPTTRDYQAPPNTFLKVYNLPTWNCGKFTAVEPDEFTCDLSGLIFPAGVALVLTTNSTGQHPPEFMREGQPVSVPTNPLSAIRFTDVKTDETIGSGSSMVAAIKLVGRRPDATIVSTTDYESAFMWGTDHGIIDYNPAITLSPAPYPWNLTKRGQNVGSQTRFVYSSSPRGNDSISRSGDGRSISEQLKFRDYDSSSYPYPPSYEEQTRFFPNLNGHSDDIVHPNPKPTGIPGTSTFGQPAITYIQPANWPDYHVSLTNSPNTAYAIVANGNMKSIGELGHIYDPFRRQQPANANGPAASVLNARGGGRSLRVGQIDDLVESSPFAVPSGTATTEWRNAAWHLTDIFSVADDITKAGKLNINGVLRDDGVALRAALRKMNFLAAPMGDTLRADALLSPTEIDALIVDLKNYLTSKGPFMERGQMSQLPFFSGIATAGNQPGQTSIDRSREEIFRRIVEMVTTRSASFSAYCVGEIVQQKPDGTLFTRGRRFKKVTSRIHPLHAGQNIEMGGPADRADAYHIETASFERL